MRRVSLTSVGATGAAVLALALVLALTWATAAQAQSFRAQYAEPVAASGPAAGAMCASIQSDDDLLNAGDFVSFEGSFSVAPGASLVLEDSDGTQGTLIDGENAEISSGDNGNIEISMTGEPLNAVGGDGVVSADVCDSVVTTTGISALQGVASASGASASGASASGASASGASASGAVESGSVALSVLPDTGGPVILVLLGGLAAAGAGLAVHRLRTRGR